MGKEESLQAVNPGEKSNFFEVKKGRCAGTKALA